MHKPQPLASEIDKGPVSPLLKLQKIGPIEPISELPFIGVGKLWE